uniref:Uncharacterized protein n=2 Tax=Anguilla anguilla TaxID=7936 RepID=A0A0E9U3G3_ANGAN
MIALDFNNVGSTFCSHFSSKPVSSMYVLVQ